jgi:hypothetical protein
LSILGCGQAQLSSNPDGTRTVFLTDARWKTDTCQHPSYGQLFQEQTSGDRASASGGAPYLAGLAEQAVTTWVDLDANGRLLRAEVRAGTTRDGTLLEAWELERDEQLSPERVPVAAFDPAPPDAQVRWNNPLVSPDSNTPSVRTATLTEALALARSPLFGLMPAVLAASGAPTSTTALTATLDSITVGIPQPAGPSLFDDAVIRSALRGGSAIQLSYTIKEPAGWPILYLYEGPASSFGAYLRATTHWSSSAPIAVQVGDRAIAGWQVTTPQDSTTWTLFEIDGTLIAVEYPPDKAPTIIAGLRRLAAP